MRAASHVFDPRLAREDAGIVDESVEPAATRIDRGEQARDVLLPGHVGRDRERVAASHFDGLHDARRGIFIVPVVHADRVAAPCGQQRAGGADAAAGARDQYCFMHGRPWSRNRTSIPRYSKIGTIASGAL